MRTDVQGDSSATDGLSESAPDRASQTHLWFTADSPVGPVFVAHSNGWVSGLQITAGRRREPPIPGRLRRLHATTRSENRRRSRSSIPDPKIVARVSEALATGRTDVPVDLSSRSAFHQEVLRATARIPRGEVRTYGELAEIVGRPRAARAVGTAMARNPVPLLVPCHRVVPSSGGVGNYGFSSDLKAKLLAGEGVAL